MVTINFKDETLKREEIENLSLTEMKIVAKNLDIKGYTQVKTKAKMLEKINEELDTLMVDEVPDLVKEEKEEEVVVKAKEAPKKTRMRIRDFPRRKVKVSARDSNIKDYPFSVNEYTCLIKMEEPVSLPEPVIEFIKTITQVQFEKDDNGYAREIEVNKFFVSYV